jgi:hypothetical protein
VRALHSGKDRIFVGGDFTSIGGSSRNYLASISTNGTLDSSAPTTNGFVYALESNGGNLYVGGSFTQVTVSSTSSTRNRLAAFSLSDWSLSAFNPNASSTVLSLAAGNSSLYAGGIFSTIGGLTRPLLAKLNLSTGVADAGFDANATGTAVRALLLDEDSAGPLYAAGDFTNLGGGGFSNYQPLDVSTGASAAGGMNANGVVYSLAYDRNSVAGNRALWAGGAFTTFNGSGRLGLARITAPGSAPALAGANADLDSGAIVYALTPDPETHFYCGGSFNQAVDSGDTVTAPNLVGLDASAAPF